jgi:uncharacterized protein
MIDGIDDIRFPETGARLAPYWAAAREGRLLLPQCRTCGALHWYPRSLCPTCLSDDIAWIASPGLGEVMSFSVMRAKTPYVIAYVTIDEGLTMMTNIITETPEAVAIGQRVRLEFVMRSATPVPVFVVV